MKDFFNKPDFGLLVIRVVVGLLIFGNGIKAFIAGDSMLIYMGKQMSLIGVGGSPFMWGVLAALTFILGGLFFALGVFFRYAAFLLFFTMFIASYYHIRSGGDIIKEGGYAFTLASVFLGMLFTGPGTISISKNY